MSVSLQIATYNRTALLRRTLTRLTSQLLPDEVLIIDDGSTDGDVESLCRSFEDRLPVRHIYNHRPYIASSCQARNVGIRNTDCDLIITSGPEILFVTEVVDQLRQAMWMRPTRTHSAGVVRHQSIDGIASLQIQGASWYTTICPRRWLEQIGGWDEAMPGAYGFDDCDLHRRLNVSRGFAVDHVVIDCQVPQAEIVHLWHPSSYDCLEGGRGIAANDEYHRFQLEKWRSQQSKGAVDVVANRGRDWGQPIPRS